MCCTLHKINTPVCPTLQGRNHTHQCLRSPSAPRLTAPESYHYPRPKQQRLVLLVFVLYVKWNHRISTLVCLVSFIQLVCETKCYFYVWVILSSVVHFNVRIHHNYLFYCGWAFGYLSQWDSYM